MLLFSFILFSPWWITVIAGIVFTVFFRAFYEAVFWAFFFDLLYGTAAASFLNFTFLFTASAVVFVLVLERINKMTRFY